MAEGGPSPQSAGQSGGRGKGRGRGTKKKSTNKSKSDTTTTNNTNTNEKNSTDNNKSSSSPSNKSINNGGRGRGSRRNNKNTAGRGGNNNKKKGTTMSSTAGAPSNNNKMNKPKVNDINDDSIEAKVEKMSDQDVLIAFGPHVRSGNANASRIHQEYLSNSKQKEFIIKARQFLIDVENKPQSNNNDIENKIEVQSNNYANETNTKREAAQDQRPISNGAVTEIQPPEAKNMGPPPGLQTSFNNMNTTTNSNVTNNGNRLPPGLISMSPGIRGVEDAPNTMNINNNNNNILPAVTQIPTRLPSFSLPPGMPPAMKPLPPGMPPQMRPPTAVVAPSPPSKPSTSSILPARSPPAAAKESTSNNTSATTPAAKPGKVWRTQTRCEVQPGRLFANDIPNIAYNNPNNNNNNQKNTSIATRPRSELTARWVLPLPYLRNRALRRFEEQKLSNGAPQNLTIRDALKDLAVGLFRRGAMDSGSQSAIVSKEILADSGKRDGGKSGRPSDDYFFNVDQRQDAVYGTVPFYSPRTPGNVVFRLYFEDEPQTTLATGPCIHVVPSDGDVDSVLRFILSNFKSKKTNGVSSINAFTSVLSLFSPRGNNIDQARSRIACGCICECRKVVEQASATYLKKKREIKEKLEELEEADVLMKNLPDLDALVINDDEKTKSSSASNVKEEDDDKDKNDASSEAKAKLISEEFSVERKWREMQVMYAAVLQAAVSNNAIHLLFHRREHLTQIQLEYELWCPFTEAFTPNPYPRTNHESSKLPGDVTAFPYPVGKEHVQKCHESRGIMQEKVMGFVPQSCPILPSRLGAWKKEGRNFFKDLSSAMNEVYHDEYAVSDKVWQRRERVRATIEHIVAASGEFPTGTKVMVFGSSANGFGSPSADLDLCLQIPQSATNFSKDEGGVEAMTNLAVKFTEAGLTDVDTVRLTARIPIVKFNVPYKHDGEEILVECDLSLQNPLACLNTSLLHTYSKISKTTRVLASIIKRWAKNRDINNPSKHTLSSYGYVIMLLSFLTSNDFDKNGHLREKNANSPNPILPNLQLVDPIWAQNPYGPYREIPAKPKTKETMVQHPNEPNYYVNSYFYRTGLEGLTKFCSENHNTESALGALLASFFHYFAYDFDYKKHVVSMSAKHSSPPIEREVKAEEDGWSIYKTSLAIEDPFELFYDVAHVVKTPNFQHIRKEFALAYTKIVNAAYKSGDNLPSGKDIIDSICEPVSTESDTDSAPGIGAGGILPNRGAGRGSGQVLSEEKLKIWANNMRQKFMQSKDKNELIMSIEEVLSSPNASKIIVATNVDYAADCKASELKSIIEMFEHLYRSGKITKSDIESAMADLVEFIDSFACDNPRIYDYVGDMFCSFANMQALTVAWLADCTSKVMDESCKPKVIDGAMKSIQKEYGTKAVKSCFGNSERQALERLLGKAKLTELEAQFVR